MQVLATQKMSLYNKLLADDSTEKTNCSLSSLALLRSVSLLHRSSTNQVFDFFLYVA